MSTATMVFLTQTTSATQVTVRVTWYYIHCEETHDPGNGEFFVKIRWEDDNVYQYDTFDEVSLGEDENDYPGEIIWITYSDYPGTVDVQLWEDDWIGDDLIIDWRSTTIPSVGSSTFSWEYESPPGGCYIRIDFRTFSLD